MDGTNKKKELRCDRHTVSLLTDHMVFSPKYRGKILIDEVAFLAEAIIRKTCVELNIEIIDMAVNPDHVHLFIKYPRSIPLALLQRKSKVLPVKFSGKNSLT